MFRWKPSSEVSNYHWHCNPPPSLSVGFRPLPQMPPFGRNREGMLAIRGAFKPPPLLGTQAILAYQPGGSPLADGKAAVL
ncbi:hypothetical protein RvVAR031_pl04650 (plasmid) [Agrobacterium vitis]|nr:hypothetical protein RvVAR031_pl04650 [Agrobacterium vitis]